MITITARQALANSTHFRNEGLFWLKKSIDARRAGDTKSKARARLRLGGDTENKARARLRLGGDTENKALARWRLVGETKNEAFARWRLARVTRQQKTIRRLAFLDYLPRRWLDGN